MILAWLLVTYGITVAITTSKAGDPLRRLFSLTNLGRIFIHCPMCVGFWVGVGLSFVGLTVIPGSLPAWLGHTLSGFAALAWCWSVHVVLHHLGAAQH